MGLIKFDINNKTFIIFITSLVWSINFRTTFKNIDKHMDLGSYSSLKFDPILILIKNIFCCFYLLGFIYEKKIIKTTQKNEKELIHSHEGGYVIAEYKERKSGQNSIFQSVNQIHRLDDIKLKIIFWIKIFFIIVAIYFIEELYFIIDNNHILDRILCPIRNLSIFTSLLIISPFLIKNNFILYKHQYIPFIISLVLSTLIIFYNITEIDRFKNIYGLNIIFYTISFLLIGLEMILIKYLVDIKFVNIFLILGIKGILGTFIFGIINIMCNKKDLFNFFDIFLKYQYDNSFAFSLYQKIFYVISLIILQYLKIFTINQFTESHLLSVIMITDIIYFPFYCIERFVIEEFHISTANNFYLNVFLGFINLFLMLIFNEIIECKFWGLDTNLKKNINKRQKEDYLNSLTIQDSLMLFPEGKEDNISEA